MADQWYYSKQGQRVGPVSEEQLKQLISSSQVQLTDLVWKQGMDQWAQAGETIPLPPAAPNIPPPVPTQSAQIGNKTKELMVSLASCGKEAAQVVAKQAERTKITTISLPNSYHALGKHVFNSGSHRSDLAQLFQQIDGFINDINSVQARSASEPKAEGIASKTAAAAKGAKDVAQIKALQMKANHALGQLGKAAFETYGDQSGPQELTHPITDLLTRVAELDGEIRELSKPHGPELSKQVGGLWNVSKENPIFIGGLLLFCFPVGLFLVWKHSTWTGRTKWIWTGAWVALMVVAMANRGEERKGEGVSEKRGRETMEASGSTKPALSINAFQLVNDYKSNEVAADEHYKGKVLKVSGIIESIGKDIMDAMYVSLKGGGGFEIRGVQCYFADDETDKLAKLSKGQQITIKGRCDGLMMNVLLKECAIIE